MSTQLREGILDGLTGNGVVLSGARLGYSKWFEGERLTEAALGHTLRVVVDAGEKMTFLKKVILVGEKVPGWSPPQRIEKSGPWGGGGFRRISPEELELKREEGVRIARSVSIDRAIQMAEKGIAIEKVAPLARVVEEYLLQGRLPGPAAAARSPEVPPDPSRREGSTPVSDGVAPSAPPPGEAAPEEPAPVPPKASRPKRPTSQEVNGLFNEARRANLVVDWKAYEALIRRIVGAEVKSPYSLTAEEFSRVVAYLQPRIAHAKVA